MPKRNALESDSYDLKRYKKGDLYMSETKRILMERDGLTEKEAEELMDECREALLSGDFEAIGDYLRLEDDYIFDLI